MAWRPAHISKRLQCQSGWGHPKANAEDPRLTQYPPVVGPKVPAYLWSL